MVTLLRDVAEVAVRDLNRAVADDVGRRGRHVVVGIVDDIDYDPEA